MLFVVKKNLCCGCEECVAVCPVGAVAIAADGRAQIDTDSCLCCGACQGECPQGAITTRQQ